MADFTSPTGACYQMQSRLTYPQLIVKTMVAMKGRNVRIAFVDSDFNGTVDMGIRALKVNVGPTVPIAYHRDVLGSLMGLSIDRSNLGTLSFSRGRSRLWWMKA